MRIWARGMSLNFDPDRLHIRARHTMYIKTVRDMRKSIIAFSRPS